MKQHTFQKIHWRPARQWPLKSIPGMWRNCLEDQGSLTARLIAASKGDFSVRILSQGLCRPRLNECRALSLPLKRYALVREVLLYGCGEPWVYARSVLPLSTLTGRLRSLRHLDNRPLGALLFEDPSMRRGEMEIARVPGFLIPARCVKDSDSLWGRRSVFYLDNKPLLVSEIFLPAFRP